MGAQFDYDALRREYRIEYPEAFNYAFDVIDRKAVEDRNRTAMIWVGENGEERRLTFWELSIASNRAANYLQSLGVEKGDRIAIMLPRVPEWWIVVLAAMKIGAVSVPFATSLTAKDIEYRCNKASVRLLIAGAAEAPKADEVRSAMPTVERFVVAGGRRPGWDSYEDGAGPASRRFVPIGGERRTSISDPVILYFTSGTTGYPKMVLHDHTYTLAHRATAEVWHGVSPSDIDWTITDTGWAKTAWGAFFGQWFVGATIFVAQYERFRADRILSLVERYGVTVFCAPPTAYRKLILEDLRAYDLTELRRCTSAGEPLNPEVIEAWKRDVGQEIYEGYGLSETVVLVGTFPGMAVRPGAMGLPVPIFDVEVLDENLAPAPAGREGDIAVRVKPRHPNGVFRGYLQDDDLNREVFRGDWYLTGDRAYRDEEGYFWFVGRSDDVIKSSGYRIGPFEVESALIEHPAVVEAAVVGIPDRMKGQRVKAFVVLASGREPSSTLARELQDHVRKVTAPYKYPREIEFVSELPKTVSGKIRRVELRSRETENAA